MGPVIQKIFGAYPTTQELIMVENFGLYLKNERELRGVALEEIAQSTKIHIRFLEALENNDFDNMPGEVFVKGFIRSYARVIGFDSEEMVNAYDESVGRDRREEYEKVQVIKEEIQARKKTVTGYIFGGIALVVIFSLGYLVFDKIIDESNKQRVERLPAGEPSSETEKPPISSETTPPHEIESDNAGNLNEETPAESLQNTSPSIDTETQPEATLENPSPPAPTEPVPEIIQAEVKKHEVTSTEPEPSVKPSEPAEDKKVVSETPIESAVTEKNSDSSEKQVIIQQVTEEPVASVDTDQSLSEADVKPLHLKIQVQGNSWFNVTVDDSNEEDFILPGGSTKSVYGREKIRLTIGNRKDTQLFLNEQPIDLPPGSSDVIRNFDITANLLE